MKNSQYKVIFQYFQFSQLVTVRTCRSTSEACALMVIFLRDNFIGLLASCNLYSFRKEDSAASYIQFGLLSLQGHTLP
jgi:hypothetical protein